MGAIAPPFRGYPGFPPGFDYIFEFGGPAGIQHFDGADPRGYERIAASEGHGSACVKKEYSNHNNQYGF